VQSATNAMIKTPILFTVCLRQTKGAECLAGCASAASGPSEAKDGESAASAC